jgi:hypothetical protein
MGLRFVKKSLSESIHMSPKQAGCLRGGKKFFRKKNEISHPFGKHIDTYGTPRKEE